MTRMFEDCQVPCSTLFIISVLFATTIQQGILQVNNAGNSVENLTSELGGGVKNYDVSCFHNNFPNIITINITDVEYMAMIKPSQPLVPLLNLDVKGSHIYELNNLGRRNLDVRSYAVLQETAYSQHGLVIWSQSVFREANSNSYMLGQNFSSPASKFFFRFENIKAENPKWELRFKSGIKDLGNLVYSDSQHYEEKLARDAVKRAKVWYLKIQIIIIDSQTKRFYPNQINLVVNIQQTVEFQYFPEMPFIFHLNDKGGQSGLPWIQMQSYVMTSMMHQIPSMRSDPSVQFKFLKFQSNTTTNVSYNISSNSNAFHHNSTVTALKLNLWTEALLRLDNERVNDKWKKVIIYEPKSKTLKINPQALNEKLAFEKINLLYNSLYTTNEAKNASNHYIPNSSNIRSLINNFRLMSLTFKPQLRQGQLKSTIGNNTTLGKNHEIYILEEEGEGIPIGGVGKGRETSTSMNAWKVRFNFMKRSQQYPTFKRGYYWSVKMKERPTPLIFQENLMANSYAFKEDTTSQIYLQPGKGKFLQSQSTSGDSATFKDGGSSNDATTINLVDSVDTRSFEYLLRARQNFTYFFASSLPGEIPTTRPYLDVKEDGSILRIGNSHLLDYESERDHLLNDVVICAAPINSNPMIKRDLSFVPNTNLSCREFLVHLSLDNINDNYPIYKQNLYAITISELSPPSTFITKVEAEDADIDSKITYSIPSKDTYAKFFDVHPTTGVVKTVTTIKGKINKDTISLPIIADDGAIDHATTTIIKIRIIKNRDERIVFTSPAKELAIFEIPEDTLPGTLVTILEAEKARKTVKDVYEDEELRGEDVGKKVDKGKSDGNQDDLSDYLNDDPFSIYEGVYQDPKDLLLELKRRRKREFRAKTSSNSEYPFLDIAHELSNTSTITSTKPGATTSQQHAYEFRGTSHGKVEDGKPFNEDGVIIIYEFYDPNVKVSEQQSENDHIWKLHNDMLTNDASAAFLEANQIHYTQMHEFFCLGTLTGKLTMCLTPSTQERAEMPVGLALDRETKDVYNFTIIARSISMVDDISIAFPNNQSSKEGSLYKDHELVDGLNNTNDTIGQKLDIRGRNNFALRNLASQGKKITTLASAFIFIQILVADVNDNYPHFVLDSGRAIRDSVGDHWYRIIQTQEEVEVSAPPPDVQAIQYYSNDSASVLQEGMVRVSLNTNETITETKMWLLPPTVRFVVSEDDSFNETFQQKKIVQKQGSRLRADELLYWKNNLARSRDLPFVNFRTPGSNDEFYGRTRPTREIGNLNVTDPDLGDNGTFYFCMVCADFPEDHITVDYYSGRLISTSYVDRELRSYYSALITVYPTPYLPCDPPIYQNFNFTQPDFGKVCSGKLKRLPSDEHPKEYSGDKDTMYIEQDEKLGIGANLSTVLINITIADVNDHPPKLERSTFYVGVHWRTNQGETITQIKLFDGDFEVECCRNYTFKLTELSFYGEKGRSKQATKTQGRSHYEKWFQVQYLTTNGGGILILKNGILGLESYVDGYFKMKLTVRDRKREQFKDSAIIYVWVYGEGRTLTVSMDILKSIKLKDISYKLFSETLSHTVSNNIILTTMESARKLEVIKAFIRDKTASHDYDNKKSEYEYDYTLPPKYSFEISIQVVDRLSFNLLSEHQIMHLIDTKPESFYQFRISPMTVTSIRPKRSYLSEMRLAANREMTIPTLGQPDRLLTIMVCAIFVTMVTGSVILLLWIFLLGTPDFETAHGFKSKSKIEESTLKKDKEIYTVAAQSLIRNTRTNPLWMDVATLQNPLQEKTIETIQKYYF